MNALVMLPDLVRVCWQSAAQKLILHRASMSVYADSLRKRVRDVEHVELAQFGQSEAADLGKLLKQRGKHKWQVPSGCHCSLRVENSLLPDLFFHVR